ncbi:unnamed protein product, partial [Ascophyllum nodosum]
MRFWRSGKSGVDGHPEAMSPGSKNGTMFGPSQHRTCSRFSNLEAFL